MKSASCFIILSLAILKSSVSVEQFDEVAWMDNTGRDRYFDYSEQVPPVENSPVNCSDNVDSSQFEKTRQPVRRHIKDEAANVVDLFVNTVTSTIRKFVKPKKKIHVENETDKGLDVALVNPIDQGDFGNSQDLQLIYLGTKWCGAGSIAKNKRDIGYFYMTDSCCRQHDLCPKSIEAQESNYGLRNNGKFTRSHCDCDDEFYRCLKGVNSLVSNQIGLLYFSVLGPQCFKEDYPMTCREKVRGRCVSYSSDTRQPKLYQWIDNKFF